jgi:hypothetical protein
MTIRQFSCSMLYSTKTPCGLLPEQTNFSPLQIFHLYLIAAVLITLFSAIMTARIQFLSAEFSPLLS